MTIEDLQHICKSLPEVTEDIKWEHHLCFSIAAKMFLMLSLDQAPVTASFKVSDEDFNELLGRNGFLPAPYLARYKWIFTDDINRMGDKEWDQRISEAYYLIRAKLPGKILRELGLKD